MHDASTYLEEIILLKAERDETSELEAALEMWDSVLEHKNRLEAIIGHMTLIDCESGTVH